MVDRRKSKSLAIEGTGLSIMHRVTGADGKPITQDDISSIAYTVHDNKTGEQTVSSTLSKSVVIFNTLQTDVRWTQGKIGYNFRYDISPSELPNGGRSYDFEILLQPINSGDIIAILHEVDVLELKGS